MARFFNDGSSEYLERDDAPVKAAPLTMACWVWNDDAALGHSAMWLGDKDSGTQFWSLECSGNVAGDPIQFLVVSGGAVATATTTTGYSLNTWHHICAIEKASNDRSVFIDNGNVGANADGRIPSNADRVAIGRRADLSPLRYMSGGIAGPAIWNCALTTRERQKLADGCPPPFIRPQSLAVYWPLVSAEDFDWYRRYDLAAFNSPGIAPHPPKVLEFWRRYRMRAVTTQGISRLVSWGVPNEWNVRAMAPVLTTTTDLTLDTRVVALALAARSSGLTLDTRGVNLILESGR